MRSVVKSAAVLSRHHGNEPVGNWRSDRGRPPVGVDHPTTPLGRSQSDFTAEELVAAVHSILANEADEPALANRCTSWRRAKRSGRPVVIVLCGAPFTGKSTLATPIAVRLDITLVVTSDAMRDVLRTVVPEAVLPELHRSTFELLAPDSPEPFSGFDCQTKAVGSAAVAIADRLADEQVS